MDINKMAQFARLQREAEEEPPIPAANNHSSPDHAQLEEIFIPIEDDEPSELPDDGYSAVSDAEEETQPPAEATAFVEETLEQESIESIISKCFTDEKAYNIELERLLPLRSPIFTDGGDISGLCSSIARVGITEPLLVRSVGNGEYEILSGNRRRAAAEQLMWVKVPCRIGDGNLITDEYAKRIVVETNRQRFPALTLSEQIQVSAILGKRAEKELNISQEQAERFSRLNALERDFLVMLDSGAINMTAAETLEELNSDTQKLLLNVLKQHPEMKLTPSNIKDLSNADGLNEGKIIEILKPKPPVMVSVPAELITEFMDGKSPEELTEIVTAAIRRYFSNGE